MKTYFHYNKIDKKYIFPTSFLSYICVIVQIDCRSHTILQVYFS